MTRINHPWPVFAIVVGFATSAAAGPCSNDIAAVGKTLAQSASLGPVTTGTLTGLGSGAGPHTATSASGGEGTAGTSAGHRIGGTAGTKELNATVGKSIATSSQDVRLQQEGKPTAAAAAAQGGGKSVETTPGKALQGDLPNDRMSQAKMELERARTLDQANDASCAAAVTKTKQLMGS